MTEQTPELDSQHILWHQNDIPNIQCLERNEVVATVPENVDNFTYCPMCGRNIRPRNGGVFTRIAKASIDKSKVEESAYSWKEMAIRQAVFPVVATVLFAAVSLVQPFEWYLAVMAFVVVAYGSLPVIGSLAYYMEEER